MAALQDLALAYLRRDGLAIPFWRMASAPVAELESRARRIGHGQVVDTVATPGGGTLPGVEIPSAGIALAGDRRQALRAADPPIMARIVDDQTVLDLRTVDPADDDNVTAALASIQAT